MNEKKKSAKDGDLPGFENLPGLERSGEMERFESNVSPPTPKGEPSESHIDVNEISVYKPTVSVSTLRVGSPLGVGGGDGKAESHIQIRVTDNGNGIPKEIVDKIFQPFFTTKPTGQGTGLGLSLSYDIVKVHGGELKVDTNPGEGTAFIISLPVG